MSVETTGWTKAVLVPGLALFAATTAHAQDAAPDKEKEILVTGNRAGQATLVPSSATVVAAEIIRDTPGRTLDDILRSIPSVTLPAASSSVVSPVLGTASMRGLGGSRALVLLDGIPLVDPFFGYTQWSLVPTERIRRVEILRGGGAAIWGNYAMGGVINVLTRTPAGNDAAASIAGGNYGTVRANAYGAVGLDPTVALDVDASTFRTDGYVSVRDVDRTALTIPNRYRADNIATTLHVEPSAQWSGSVRAGYHSIAQTLRTPLNRNDQRVWNFAGDLTGHLGGAALTITAFHIDERFVIDNVDTPTGSAPGTAEYVQNRHVTPTSSDGGAIVVSRTGDSWLQLASIGADVQAITGKDTGYIRSPAGVLLRTDIGSGEQRFAAIFIQSDLAPLPGLTLSANARLQYFENRNGFDGSPAGAGAVPDSHETSFDPRIAARYVVTPFLALRAGASRAFRAPTLSNLYRSFSTRLAVNYSNSQLKPETFTGWEAGADLTWSSLQVRTTYYRSFVDDLITTRRLARAELPSGFVAGSRAINAGRLRARGVEAEVIWRPRHDLSATFGYTYADSIITSNALDPTSVGKQIGGVPRNAAAAGLTFTPRGGWRLGTRLRWHQRYFSDNAHTLPIEAQVVVDLDAAVPLARGFELFGQVENLFDQRRITDNTGLSVPQLATPFTVLAGVRFHLK